MSELRDYLPLYYAEVMPAMNVVDREAEEITALITAIDDVLTQMFVTTATWGLARWERLFGITTDEAKPADQRKSVILAKLRGIGTVTPALVEQVAEAYDNGDVTLTEDSAHYTVTISFVNEYGVPPNMGDIQAAIRDILPAHLAITFNYKFYTYAQLVASGRTYTQLAATGKTYDQVYNGGIA